MRVGMWMMGIGLVLAACGTDPVLDTTGRLAGIEVLGGDGQTGPEGQPLPEPVRAQALREDGQVHPTAAVWMSIVSGDGSLVSAGARAAGNGAAVSAGRGLGSAEWTPGPSGQEQRLRLFVVAIEDTFSVEVTATSTPPPGA